MTGATTYQKWSVGKPWRLVHPVLLLVLAGCQGVVETPGGPTGEAPAREALALPDAPAYVLDAEASEVRVLVHRGGPLARLGHNHVIVAPLHGQIRAGDTAAASGFRVELAVHELRVDPPVLRAEEGEAFASEVSDQAREATHANMLGERLLDGEHFPRIVIESVALTGPRWNPDVLANVTLRGVTVPVRFPAAVFEREGALTVIARLSLQLTDFGIEPFSVLGGGIRVEDRLDLRVRVVARLHD